MFRLFTTALLTFLLSTTLTSANPVRFPGPPPPPDSPAANTTASDPPNTENLSIQAFSVNVVMLSGAAQIGMWVPLDGNYHYARDLTCLNIGGASYGACSNTVIDHVAVVNGFGPCTFIGSGGWLASQTGTPYSGWLTVGPPQTLAIVVCS